MEWSIIDSALGQIKENWLILLPLGAALFKLQGLRDEISLRNTIEIIVACQSSFADLNRALQAWAHPFEWKGEDKEADVKEALGRILPTAISNFQRAALFLPPHIVREMDVMFNGMHSMFLAKSSHRTFVDARREVGSGYTEEIERTFKEAKEVYPKEIAAARQRLERHFQVTLNGQFVMAWWRLRAWLGRSSKKIAFPRRSPAQ